MAKVKKDVRKCPTCQRVFEVGVDIIPVQETCPFDGTALETPGAEKDDEAA